MKTITVIGKKGSKTKQVPATLDDKKTELWRIIYPKIQKGQHYKTKTAEELVKTFKIPEEIQKRYPHTHGIEFDLIQKHIVDLLHKI